MDSRIFFATFAVVAVFLVIRGLRYVGAKWLNGQPRWIVFGLIVVIAAGIFMVSSHFNMAAMIDCLQGSTFGECASLATSVKPTQP
ncbi:hypothetical protein [Paraburkholderia sp. 32]|uniref:hypothetical protein n=1 Tax=Paraburkholderia sp. 32 TaxID=2991057 RepID=UPI003D1F26CD